MIPLFLVGIETDVTSITLGGPGGMATVTSQPLMPLQIVMGPWFEKWNFEFLAAYLYRQQASFVPIRRDSFMNMIQCASMAVSRRLLS